MLYRIGDSGFLESLIGIEFIGEGHEEAVLVKVEHRRVKLLDLAQRRASRVKIRVDRLLSGLETLVADQLACIRKYGMRGAIRKVRE